MSIYIGLMSGTSMDGVDAALVDVDTHRCIAGITRPYSVEARQFLETVLTSDKIDLATQNQLNTILGREFAAAALALLERANYSAKDVVAIGSHGQTICHDAMAHIPYTVQLACPHTIAELTGIPVVADFRTRDLVVGGQGAPFAPLYHQVLFAQQQWPIAVVNIGGIANVTFLQEAEAVRGYDTGPGNCLMDAWIQMHLHQPYDANGAWASTGRIIERLLQACLADCFFQQKPPKSLGKEYFSRAWLTSKLQNDDAPEDVQATLLALTAITISDAIHLQSVSPNSVILCGGGVHNQALFQAIQQQMAPCPVMSSAQLGIDPDYIEAMLFAWLAKKTMQGESLALMSLTGARKPAILGAIYK